MRLVQQLADIGKKIDDDEVAEILFSGLSQEFDNLVSGLETACLTSKLTVELVRARLLQEEHRRNAGDQEGVKAYLGNKKKKSSSPMFCQFCKRSGHTIKRCFRRKKELKNNEENHTMLASAMVCSGSSNHDFVVDSGASQHITANANLKNLEKEDTISGSCEPCLTGKMVRAPYPAVSTKRTTQPLELIHTDVAGPMQVETWGLARYLLTFTDDHTRKTWGYLMKQKSEMLRHRRHRRGRRSLNITVRAMKVQVTVPVMKVASQRALCLLCRSHHLIIMTTVMKWGLQGLLCLLCRSLHQVSRRCRLFPTRLVHDPYDKHEERKDVPLIQHSRHGGHL